MLHDFQVTFPTVDLRLHVEALGAVAALVLDQKADLAVAGPDIIDLPELQRAAIGSVELVPVASPSHPLALLERVDAATMRVSAQFIYPLDRPSSFRRDAEQGKVDWSDIKVSELVMVDRERLLVLERASATTKLYQVQINPAYALKPEHLEMATRPTIDELSARGDLEERVPVLKKALVLSTDDLTEFDADLEGMILLSPRTLLLVNDNDFGIEGTRTRFWRIDLAVDL